MRFRLGVLAGLGVAVAVAAGTLLAVNLAGAQDGGEPTPTSASGEQEDPSNLFLRYLANLSERLGVSPEELQQAMKDAAADTVDDLVAEGKLDAERAEKIKDFIENSDGLLPLLRQVRDRWGGGHDGGPGPAGHPRLFRELFQIAADVVGLEPGQLLQELKDGKTLAEIAAEQGISEADLIAALTSAVEERLDQAVADGKLTQEKADELLARFQDKVDELIHSSIPEGAGPPFGGGGGRGPF